MKASDMRGGEVKGCGVMLSFELEGAFGFRRWRKVGRGKTEVRKLVKVAERSR